MSEENIDNVIVVPNGTTKCKKRVGRGPGSRTGCTAGRGTKGQKARSGGSIRPGFEGGQMPLYRRLPRRGFSNYPFKKEVTVLSLDVIGKKYTSGETVSLQTLKDKKIIKKSVKMLKILLSNNKEYAISNITVAEDVCVSASVRKTITDNGGNVLSVQVQKNNSTISSASKKVQPTQAEVPVNLEVNAVAEKTEEEHKGNETQPTGDA